MATKKKKGKTLADMFAEELRDVYDAEKQLVKALPKVAEAAESEDLRIAFEEHLEQTRNQVTRLEEVFELIEQPARGKKCRGMEGLIEEAKELMEDEPPSASRDAALIAAAQKVEHYEIATYGTLATWATLLGYDQAADLLKETLSEEKETDETLTEIAEQHMNEEAADTDQETEEETPTNA